MGWEEEIAAMLQEVSSETVRFDVEQFLTQTQKSTAKSNVGVGATATFIEDNDYKLELW